MRELVAKETTFSAVEVQMVMAVAHRAISKAIGGIKPYPRIKLSNKTNSLKWGISARDNNNRVASSQAIAIVLPLVSPWVPLGLSNTLDNLRLCNCPKVKWPCCSSQYILGNN
jgi:hypothetical protein